MILSQDSMNFNYVSLWDSIEQTVNKSLTLSVPIFSVITVIYVPGFFIEITMLSGF